ncbi:hypothetical protein RRG08_024622 [Elysia crispata]|uniref:Uncharacterized protein n=1 Tax=Elysia crispata TaxID=231223 RepID=A0AAE1DPE6_9GAST|nr:hypothetical protein RRG08_024622 [Elysia crispata]
MQCSRIQTFQNQKIMDGRETQQMNWKYSGLRMPSFQMSCMILLLKKSAPKLMKKHNYNDDSFDSDFLNDSSEDEEDIATDDEDGV